jgi:hypothetical protein
LPISIQLVQLIQPKLVYIFLRTSLAYAQHESLKQVTLFFEQGALVAQTLPQTIDSLANLRTKYNYVERLLEDTNN